MRHEVGIFTSSEWVWLALILLLVCAIAGFIIYKVTRKRTDQDNSRKIIEEETEMAEIWCPNLLTEVQELRSEVNRYKDALDKPNQENAKG